MSRVASDRPLLVYTVTSRPWRRLLHQFRNGWHLMLMLAWRDFRVRYRQSLFGMLWALVPPILYVALFTLVLGGWAGLAADGQTWPYALQVAAAMILWRLFADGLQQAANAMLAARNMITRSMVPRLVIPTAAQLVCLVDLFIACLVLVAACWLLGDGTTWRLALLPLWVTLVMPLLVALGTLAAVGNAVFRDVRHGVPVLIQLWFFLTPVAYPATIIDPAWRPLAALNPMCFPVEAMRWSLLGDHPFPLWAWPGPVIGLLLVILSLRLALRIDNDLPDRI